MTSNSWQRMVLFLCLLSGMDQLSFVAARAGQQGLDQTSHYADQVAKAAQQLIKLTPADQLQQLQQPFRSSKRTAGRETSGTPSFCGVVAWCRSQGLGQGAMGQAQLFSLHRLLRQSLSSGGYQSLLSVLNRQRVIGEMEAVVDTTAVKRAAELYPEARAHTIQAFPQLARPTLRDWYPSIGGMTPLPDSKLNWSWNPPGAAIRREQFDDYALLISGDPGKGKRWGLRFEGHHLTINLTFMRDQKGDFQVAGTPLFLGAFPMVVPASPSSLRDLQSQWQWTQGQSMLFGAAQELREFWQSLPAGDRDQAKIPNDRFDQVSPLLADTPPNYLITALDPRPDPQSIRRFASIEILPKELSKKSLWHLSQAFDVYLSPMHSDVARQYRSRLNTALESNQPIQLSWAGGALADIGSHHYSYLQIGDLLLELFQSNRFSTQHESVPSGNHVHGMLRDLAFDWQQPNPVEKHLLIHHHHH